MVKSIGLYQLAATVKQGVIVEIGTYHGNGAIALASGAVGRTVYTIDDYADYVGWIGEHYGAADRVIMQEHLRQVNLPIEWIDSSSERAALKWDKPIGLLYWDIGGAEPLRADFERWGRHVMSGGLFVIHDTLDRKFESDVIIRRAMTGGLWEAGPQLPMLYCLVKK
jgi:predicted O-methyltransferase YrrM